MIVTFENGEKMRIWFRYEDSPTGCGVIVLHCQLRENEYFAQETQKHQLIKAKGRRAALARFLKNGARRLLRADPKYPVWQVDQVFPRHARVLVWREYFAQHADLKHKAAKGQTA